MDMWMDVDTALAEVPVNVMPLIDDGDFKTVEDALAYDAAGMDLRWNFVTTGGAMTSTAVTPTTGGAHDWNGQGDGLYTLEMPASGGTINNDTEGFGWFTGKITGVLPFRGPVIGFRSAALNNALIDGADVPATAAALALAQTDIDDVQAKIGTPAGASVSADILVIDNLVDDLESRLGTPVGASISVDIAAVKTDSGNLISRLGAFTGSGLNTVLGFFRALMRGDSALTPSDVGGTFDNETESLEAIRDEAAVPADIADAVWDAATADHQTAGTTGKALTDASSAGDPWSTALPGAYGSGTAGKIIGDNINATISSRATPAQVATELGTYDAPTKAELDAGLAALNDVSTAEVQTAAAAALTAYDGPTNAEMVARTLPTAEYATASALATVQADTDDMQSKIGTPSVTLADDIAAIPTAAEINAEVVDALNVDTYSDPAALAGAIGSALSLATKINWIFARLNRKKTFNKTTGDHTIYNSSGTAIGKGVASDDGTTTEESQLGAP